MDEKHAVQEEGALVRHDGNGQKTAYEGGTYYDLPPVKHSTYHWMIGASYFSIGLAGASQVLSAILDLSDVPDKEPMVRTGRYAALAGSLVTPALYIIDLGAPRKWYHMLRIYRRTSLMSVGGAWLLTAFGVSSGGAALGQALEDLGYRTPGRIFSGVFGIPAALVGSFMSIYMGTELEETSTPLWAETSPLLSSLFGLSNASNALALFELAGESSHTQEEGVRPVRFLAMLSEAAAIFQLRRVELRWTESGRASALYRSRYDLLYRTGLVTLGKTIGLLLRAADFLGGTAWRRFRPLASLATLATGYALPTIILYQGNSSADRPEDYFEYTSPAQMKTASPVAGDGSRERPGPPRTLTLMKWLAIAGLAVGTAALVMKPKKAY